MRPDLRWIQTLYRPSRNRLKPKTAVDHGTGSARCRSAFTQLSCSHHCHTGAIATAGVGTALGVITEAHRGMLRHAWLDETRPRLQAALSAWELGCLGVPCTVIVDGASGLLMRRGEVMLFWSLRPGRRQW